jgi:hypothetical protein
MEVPMSFLKKITAKCSAETGFEALILQRLHLFSWYAARLDELEDKIEQEKPFGLVSETINSTPLILAIQKLDDEYAKREREYFAEFAALLKKLRKVLAPIEIKNEWGLALARLKNKINISVAHVSLETSQLLPQVKELGLSGVPLARLEYLSELTLAKQLEVFESELTTRL